MASKKYAYYKKGNKIAIVEQGFGGSSGRLAVAHCTLSAYGNKTDCEAAGGQWIPGSSGSLDNFGEYTSPTESIADGLEIEYTYAPTYNSQSTSSEGTDAHRFLGWGSNGTNLLLFTYGDNSTTAKSLSSLFAADDWIVIKGSGRWSGLHQLKLAGGSTGILTLKTRCNLRGSSITGTFNFTTDETIAGSDQAMGQKIELLKELTSHRDTLYVFIEEAVDTTNNGFFSISDTGTVGSYSLLNKYFFVNNTGDYTSAAATISEEDDDEDVVLYQAFKENITVYESIEVLQDESFELDLTHEQSLAAVYYIRARMMEDIGNLEQREYYMRLFRRTLEKDSSANKVGAHIMQSHWNLK